MRQIKLFTLLLILILGSVSFYSCSNGSSKNDSQKEKYQPSILDSDRIIKCYYLGGTAEDILLGVQRAMPFGNILVSQNGIIKAVQTQYSNKEIVWSEIVYFSINDDYRQFKCKITGKTFNNCADITYKDKESLLEHDKNIRIFWN